MDSSFNEESYYSYLKTSRLGRLCMYLDKVESTIDVALKAEPDTIVIAKEQSKGRGQRTNVWHSPQGCAMGSIKLICGKRTFLASRLCFLQHIMALVVAKTLEQIDQKKLGKNHIRLKWPNDIIYFKSLNEKGLKIGGVLAQTMQNNDDYSITLSFGLNVFNSQPTTCIKDVIGPSTGLNLSFLVAEFVNKLEQYTYHLDQENFQQLKLEYTERCIQMNQVIEDEQNGEVKIKEVNDDGYLIGERCADQRLCTVTKIRNANSIVM